MSGSRNRRQRADNDKEQIFIRDSATIRVDQRLKTVVEKARVSCLAGSVCRRTGKVRPVDSRTPNCTHVVLYYGSTGAGVFHQQFMFFRWAAGLPSAAILLRTFDAQIAGSLV
jgi:hypothetical protein